MKCFGKNIEKNGAGHIVLMAEESEDVWHAYNLIAVGDRLKSTTVRRVHVETATGSTGSNRVKMKVCISIEGVEYDSTASQLRIKGRNAEENPYIKMGGYHTVDLGLNQKFTLNKGYWDILSLERIETACDPTQKADVLAAVMEEGLCNICLVTSAMTIVRSRIEMNIPRKRKGACSRRDKAMLQFYDSIIHGLRRHANFKVLKCVIIASPGFVKDQFYEYMMAEAMKHEYKDVIENQSKFILMHSSSGRKHALKDLLADTSVAAKLADTKAAGEVKTLDNFFKMLQNEPNRAFYGIGHVERANNEEAIQILLLSDDLFRSCDLQTRLRYVNLVESVKGYGGEVKVFSSLHVSGEQLSQLSGVAAILRFPLPELESDVDEDDSDLDA